MKLRFCLLAASLLAACFAHGAGRQLTGVYAPAATPPLPPPEATKKFTLPEGFEIRIFAAEPDVVNPVAMTWDERGRLWVVELYEYPLGAAPGAKPRDKVKILEDTDGDGKADKVKVFADGLNLATGVLVGNGGVYVGQAPHLFFFEDTDGDDVADKKTTVMTGFGLEDRHELLNGFTWGPDGWLYMTHGVFTYSMVKDPNNPNDDGVVMTAAVARYHPRSKKFEVFAEGTSNPWGVDFDRYGNAYVSACVIDHLYHMAPGGIYTRQAGNPPHPYAYELLPSIVDHKHFRAAYAGVQVYQGHQFPKEHLGTILMGNIHDSAVHQDRLTPNGSSFKASFVRDFVRSNDGWFRPVSIQVGPDGAVWIMDWYDKYPCYQNANADPEGVDREHGRIWRVVYTGNKPGAPVPSRDPKMDLRKASATELVELLKHPNSWHRRTAQKVLSERRDATARPKLVELARSSEALETRLAALWTLHGAEQLDESLLGSLAADATPAMRAWVARLVGERGEYNEELTETLLKLAEDSEPAVRLAVATMLRQLTSGALTVDKPPRVEPRGGLARVFSRLVYASKDGQDPVLPFMIWHALEPYFAYAQEPVLKWFLDHGEKTSPLSAKLIAKSMRRICDMQDPGRLDLAVQFISMLPAEAASSLGAALDGLLEGQKGKALLPSQPATELLAKLAANPSAEIASKARQLGAVWGDAAALQASLKIVRDPSAREGDRVQAIQSVKQQKIEGVRQSLLGLLETERSETVLHESIRALSEIGGDNIPEQLLKIWKKSNSATQRLIAQALTSRGNWTRAFITAIEKNLVSASELPAPVIRSLVDSKDDYARNRARLIIGRFRETDQDKLKLIAQKKAVVLNGPVDLEAGHELAKKTCLTCHKLHGEGAEVGPDLTGVGRSSLEALLANVIDPNQLIGKGYENVEIETKDGRSVSGRMVENTDSRVKLLAAGPKEEIVSKSDIASMRVSEISVMPEGLEQMPDGDFRNMIGFILNHPKDQKGPAGQ